jgi:diguanylate cyclase (GGDEF)-like protein
VAFPGGGAGAETGGTAGSPCGPDEWRLRGYRIGLPFVVIVLAEQVVRFWGTPVAFSKGSVVVALVLFWLTSFLRPAMTLRYDQAVIMFTVWVSFLEGMLLLTLPAQAAMGVALLREVAYWGPVICAYWAIPLQPRVRRTVFLVAIFYAALLLANHLAQKLTGVGIFAGTPLQAIGQAVILSIIVWAAGRLHQGITSERDQAMRKALHDRLTGLLNRHAFEIELCRSVGLAARHEQEFALLLLDIDHFKRLNDRHGHLVGDEALQGVADICRSTLRQTDMLCRWGGEEFAIILPHVSAFESCRIANNLRRRIAESVRCGGEPVTVSCGIAVHRAGETPQALFARADSALFRAKDEGRNRIACSHDCPGADVQLAA